MCMRHPLEGREVETEIEGINIIKCKDNEFIEIRYKVKPKNRTHTIWYQYFEEGKFQAVDSSQFSPLSFPNMEETIEIPEENWNDYNQYELTCWFTI